MSASGEGSMEVIWLQEAQYFLKHARKLLLLEIQKFILPLKAKTHKVQPVWSKITVFYMRVQLLQAKQILQGCKIKNKQKQGYWEHRKTMLRVPLNAQINLTSSAGA